MALQRLPVLWRAAVRATVANPVSSGSIWDVRRCTLTTCAPVARAVATGQGAELVSAFNGPPPVPMGKPGGGLLANDLLRDTNGFFQFAIQARDRCATMAEEMDRMGVERSWSTEHSPVHILDNMSDTLCQVLDFGEMLRQVREPTKNHKEGKSRKNWSDGRGRVILPFLPA